MSHAPIIIGGIPLPSDEPVFLVILAVHVVAGLTCAITGIIAMLSNKVPGRHPRSGTLYYRSLVVVFVTMAALSAMRWAEDYHLFLLGVLSMATAFVGRRAAPSRVIGRIHVHVTAMGLSYILLTIAFYVDNGKNLPIWRNLPSPAYWLIPLVVGLPLIIRALLYHPLLKVEGGSDHSGGAA